MGAASAASGTTPIALSPASVTYGFGELDALAPAYAVTIHKSQGSEYPAVVIPVITQHYTMLQRNLLYTGITRGKKLVVVAGQRKALATAVRQNDTRKRHGGLLARLKRGSSVPGTATPQEM